MNALTHMSDIMIPMVIFWIVGYGMVSGVKVYETFLKGAKEGLRIVVEILPTLVGLMMAVGILRTSGFFDLFKVVLTWKVKSQNGQNMVPRESETAEKNENSDCLS